MEEAIQNLDIQFKRINNDLQYSAHRIEAQFSTITEAEEVPYVPHLIKRIQTLQAELCKLKESTQELCTAKQEVLPALTEQLLANYHVVSVLCNRATLQPDDSWVQAAAAVQELQDAHGGGSDTTSSTAGLAQTKLSSQTTGALESSYHATGLPPHGLEVAIGTHRPKETVLPTAWSVLAEGSNEILESAFQNVPASVRGRVKLGQVQSLFCGILQVAHKEASARAAPPATRARNQKRQKSNPISLKVLDAEGLKVSGLTGASMLATLQSLGLIKVTKNSVVLLNGSRYTQ